MPPSHTQRTGRPANPLYRRPGFLIRRMHQIHLAMFAEECAGFDITAVQYIIISVVARRRRLDQAQLAAEVGIDQATMANVAARLQGKGILQRAPSSTDKRQKLVSITPLGRSLLQKMQAPAGRAHARTVAALPPEDRKLFLRLLHRLVEAGNETSRAPLRLR